MSRSDKISEAAEIAALQEVAIAEAQLQIIRTLKPLPEDSRNRLLSAVGHILEADRQVPGLFDLFRKGLERA